MLPYPVPDEIFSALSLGRGIRSIIYVQRVLLVFVCEGRLLIACWHTEKRRGRRLSWLLKHISHRGTVVRGATGVVCKLYLKLYAQGIYAKVIRNQFASSPSLFVPSAPPCITYNSVHSVSQCALLCNRLGLGLHITEGLFYQLIGSFMASNLSL